MTFWQLLISLLKRRVIFQISFFLLLTDRRRCRLPSLNIGDCDHVLTNPHPFVEWWLEKSVRTKRNRTVSFKIPRKPISNQWHFRRHDTGQFVNGFDDNRIIDNFFIKSLIFPPFASESCATNYFLMQKTQFPSGRERTHHRVRGSHLLFIIIFLEFKSKSSSINYFDIAKKTKIIFNWAGTNSPPHA